MYVEVPFYILIELNYILINLMRIIAVNSLINWITTPLAFTMPQGVVLAFCLANIMTALLGMLLLRRFK
jgi:hypothetical protein